MEKENSFHTSFDNIQHNNIPFIAQIITKAKACCCDRTWPRIAGILMNIIQQNKEALKKECYIGLPDDLPCLRALVWKINLRYLSTDVNKWETSIPKKRKEYIDIKNAFMLRFKAEIEIFQEVESNLMRTSITEEEKNNVILLSKNTDRELLETIDKDVNRTHMNFDFFSKPIKENEMMTQEELDKMLNRKRNCTYQDFKTVYTKGRGDINMTISNETHADVLGRILYIYSKLNKDVSYVQGMNEILAPIYYCYSIGNFDNTSTEYIEADTYWSFSNLMEDIKGMFIKEKDNDKTGIFNKINLFEKVIEKCEKSIYKQLKKYDVSVMHFSFRWFNLFFGQDFMMPDILRLWDTVFSELDRFYFIYFLSLAVLKWKKKEILKSDFFGIINCLQKIECDDIEQLIEMGIKIKQEHEKKVRNIIYDKEAKEVLNINNKNI